MSLPTPITDAIEALSDLPGIGKRSAERLIFSLLKNESGLDQKIAKRLGELKSKIHECPISHNYCEGVICPIQADTKRDDRLLCVVESPMDVIALERTHEFKGRYHVLHGVISPLEKVRPESLRIESLLQRIHDTPEIKEIILALSGTTEAEATALYLVHQLKDVFHGEISRLSRGIPSGGDLDYLDVGTLSRAMSERRNF